MEINWASIGPWLLTMVFVFGSALALCIVAVPEVARWAAATINGWADAVEYFVDVVPVYRQESRERASKKRSERVRQL